MDDREWSPKDAQVELFVAVAEQLAAVEISAAVVEKWPRGTMATTTISTNTFHNTHKPHEGSLSMGLDVWPKEVISQVLDALGGTKAQQTVTLKV